MSEEMVATGKRIKGKEDCPYYKWRFVHQALKNIDCYNCPDIFECEVNWEISKMVWLNILTGKVEVVLLKEGEEQ